ncbi:MAG: HAD-IIIC family phosphatase [Deltaproteobacteria bacterium]|nr:HAD-IIIC family phosphatase [Deltaproteobacteria bacterium]
MSKTVKCLVWDLDETLWDGVLLEGGGQRLRPGAREVVESLDQRGILQSIASRNDHDHAMANLSRLGLEDYFLYPQIHFGPKSESLRTIAQKLNIGLNTFAFIDDQPFEREEVGQALPEVLRLDAAELTAVPELARFIPRFVTEDSAMRRQLYLTDQSRAKAEENFSGPTEAFLASLNMRFTIAPVADGDLQRAVDLTERTHQLNATGLTFGHDELDALRLSPDHWLLMSSLEDKFGPYGKIGLALVEKGAEAWRLKLLLMSCRVMSRGVGSVMLNHVIAEAGRAGKRLQAEFVETDRNRMMYVTYKFAGFEEVARDGAWSLLEYQGDGRVGFPSYLDVRILA